VFLNRTMPTRKKFLSTPRHARIDLVIGAGNTQIEARKWTPGELFPAHPSPQVTNAKASMIGGIALILGSVQFVFHVCYFATVTVIRLRLGFQHPRSDGPKDGTPRSKEKDIQAIT
jgi:hypothetical protein